MTHVCRSTLDRLPLPRGLKGPTISSRVEDHQVLYGREFEQIKEFGGEAKTLRTNKKVPGRSGGNNFSNEA